MIKNLICTFEGKVIAIGQAKAVEKFIFVDLPDKYTEAMTPSEFQGWLTENPNWKLA